MRLHVTLFGAALALSLAGLPAFVGPSLASASTVETATADFSGTYTWEGFGGGGGGGGGQTTTLTLKQEGETVTGTISGRNGDTPIEDGKVEGDTVKFKVTREFNGNKMVTSYSGTLSDGTLKLTLTTSRDIEAKKQS